MFSWFKKKPPAPPAPAAGPDFAHIDSRAKAEELAGRGELHKLLLLPALFGGEDVPPNVLYVPAFVVDVKRSIDENVIRPLAEQQKVGRYVAHPVYEGRSFVPSAIKIEASDPGSFTVVLNVWGPALRGGAQTAQAPAGPRDTPEGTVRAFIQDYFDWNNRAAATIGQPPDEQVDRRIEQEYDALVRKYCPPGVTREPLAYGSNASHSPQASRIVAVSIDGAAAVVRTHKQMRPGSQSVHTHEFDLVLREGRWLLTGVYYVDGSERLPGL